jgi:uncharacterized paraquat-inducible protein A
MLTKPPEHKVVKCPRCGVAVWKPRLDTDGCPTCRILDSR